MSFGEYQIYIPLFLVVALVAYKWFRYRKIKNALPSLLERGAIVVDVRTQAEFTSGARPGAVNIPLAELANRSSELDKSKPVVLCCASGTRSGMGVGILKAHGFREVFNAGPWTNTLL